MLLFTGLCYSSIRECDTLPLSLLYTLGIQYRVFPRGGCTCSCSYSIDVCKHAPSRGGLGACPPRGKFFNLQPLKRFLVTPETTYTVWFVSQTQECGATNQIASFVISVTSHDFAHIIYRASLHCASDVGNNY